MALHQRFTRRKRVVTSQNPATNNQHVVVQSRPEGTHAFYSNFEHYFDANKRFVASENNLNNINNDKYMLEPYRTNGDYLEDPINGGPSPRPPPQYSHIEFFSNPDEGNKTVKSSLVQPCTNLSIVSNIKQYQDDDFNEAMNMIRPMQPAYLAPGTPIKFHPQGVHQSSSTTFMPDPYQNSYSRLNRELSVGHM
ncbi:hypothetical protein HELRODRAFT_165099 [Helobdella robusta]|uniref:Uncharacterized protein n=1 Tax=Helobdella robusta TaxID=6412 RepID=T1EWA6_HELRO|nr:hypothetical protein HELRODRAFT_165099 [Helobdella robusta]ESN92955.1 hypothetical protein HELRODRAFT_165099 [Helobdella robusta]